MSSSVAELAKQDMPNLALDDLSRLEQDKSSLEAFNNELFDEMEPILGISSINGLEPAGLELGEKLLLPE